MNRAAFGCFAFVVLLLSGLETFADQAEWQSLFDGKSLTGWTPTEFGGEGDVYVEDGQLMLDFGSSMTGVTYHGKNVPRGNYELRLEAQRLDGTDFFCGLTFPVGDAHLTLIVGGWGGSLVGLSSLDGKDASDNETRRSMAFRKRLGIAFVLKLPRHACAFGLTTSAVIDQSHHRPHSCRCVPKSNSANPWASARGKLAPPFATFRCARSRMCPRANSQRFTRLRSIVQVIADELPVRLTNAYRADGQFALREVNGLHPLVTICLLQPSCTNQEKLSGQPAHFRYGNTGRMEAGCTELPDLTSSSRAHEFGATVSMTGLSPITESRGRTSLG